MIDLYMKLEEMSPPRSSSLKRNMEEEEEEANVIKNERKSGQSRAEKA